MLFKTQFIFLKQIEVMKNALLFVFAIHKKYR